MGNLGFKKVSICTLSGRISYRTFLIPPGRNQAYESQIKIRDIGHVKS